MSCTSIIKSRIWVLELILIMITVKSRCSLDCCDKVSSCILGCGCITGCLFVDVIVDIVVESLVVLFVNLVNIDLVMQTY